LFFSIDEFDADDDFGDQLSTFKNRKYSLVFGNKFGGLSVLDLGVVLLMEKRTSKKD
jgi:hypothetical protein